MASKRRRKTKFEKMMITLTFTTIFCVFISVFFFKAQIFEDTVFAAYIFIIDSFRFYFKVTV